MQEKVFHAIDKGFKFFEDWSLFLAVSVALIVAMANIVLRKTTHVSLYWSDEVVRKVIFFSTYIGCSAAVRSRSLIRIDALPQLFPLLKKPLMVLNHLSMIGFGGMMVWLGVQMTYEVYLDTFAKTTTLEIPEWYFYAVLPLFGALTFFRSIMVMVEDWREMSG